MALVKRGRYDGRHDARPMSHRICVMGVSGAGKTVIGSRLADGLGVPFLDGDDVHPPENRRRMAQGIPLTDDDRRGWLAAIAARVAEAKRTNTGLVVSCSALKRTYREVLRGGDAAMIFVHLTGDPGLIRRRMTGRVGHYMPATLLDSQLATLEAPATEEHAWTYNVADPPESIVARIVQRLGV
jgi:gluconokinase